MPDTFETVDFGTLEGQRIGTIQAATSGVIPLNSDGRDGNLRFSGDTGSRLTDSRIYRAGTEWQADRLSGFLEVSKSTSDSTTPSFNATLNFINPNSPLDYDQLLANALESRENDNEDLYDSNENGTPFVYDLDGALTFGIAQGLDSTPTTAELLDPADVVLRDVQQSRNVAENAETAFRADLAYDLEDLSFGNGFLSSLEAGYRYNKTTSLRDQIRSSVGLREIEDSPTGDLFADLLVPGPDNFDEADGRDLFVGDFLLIDPELVASDPDAVLATLNDAIAANNARTGSTRGPISAPTSQQSAFFDIEEESKAFYGQLNFDTGVLRGNADLRYVQTDVTSTGNTIINGVAQRTSRRGSYDFVLPRINLAADIGEDVVLRAAWGQDVRRPNFDRLSTSFTFSTSPNPAVDIGNPNLEPEEVDSFDVSADWYFAPAAVVSVGY